jgi:uncharacterized membrane protein
MNDATFITSLILLGIVYVALGLFIYFAKKEDKKREQQQ